jgi:SIR2-like domain
MEDHISYCYKELFDMMGDRYKFGTVTGDDRRDYRYGPCPIYTTNYDSVIERYWKGISPINDLWIDDKGTKVLDPGRVLSGAVDVKLVKLHGSLDWFKLKNGKIVNLPSFSAKHGKQRVEGEMILYPLHQKDLYLYPWFELFKGFKHDLSKTKDWISIGYSFNDEFIRNIFHEALNDSVHKFIIVAPDANKIISDKFSNYEDYMRKINGKFGEAGTISRISNELND